METPWLEDSDVDRPVNAVADVSNFETDCAVQFVMPKNDVIGHEQTVTVGFEYVR